MKNKIPVSKLAEAIASRAECTPAEAMQFIKDLFAIVEAEITSGGEPVIPGLGAFSKSIQPGEPLIFTPDEDFAALLNEDFASFRPVKLNDGVTDEMLAGAEVAASDTESVSAVPAPADPLTITETANDETGETVSVADDEIPGDNQPEPAPVQTDDATVSKPNSIPEDEIDPIDVAAVEIDELPPDLPEETAIAKEEEEQKSSDEISDEVINEPDTAVEAAENNLTPSESADNGELHHAPETKPTSLSNIEEDEPVYVVVRKQKSRFWPGVIIGFILGFAVGVIAYLCYMLQILKLPVEDITGL